VLLLEPVAGRGALVLRGHVASHVEALHGGAIFVCVCVWWEGRCCVFFLFFVCLVEGW
jgi:hypothetical protein